MAMPLVSMEIRLEQDVVLARQRAATERESDVDHGRWQLLHRFTRAAGPGPSAGLGRWGWTLGLDAGLGHLPRTPAS